MQPSASRTAAANAAPWLAKPGQASARPAQYYKSIVYDHDRWQLVRSCNVTGDGKITVLGQVLVKTPRQGSLLNRMNRRDAATIEAQKQALFRSHWKLLPDKLELYMCDEAFCLAFAWKVGLAPVSQYSIKLVKPVLMVFLSCKSAFKLLQTGESDQVPQPLASPCVPASAALGFPLPQSHPAMALPLLQMQPECLGQQALMLGLR
ncbi:TPA: hypothetical protein ACH3X3_010037 [Trebouxia sp. C0006]